MSCTMVLPQSMHTGGAFMPFVSASLVDRSPSRMGRPPPQSAMFSPGPARTPSRCRGTTTDYLGVPSTELDPRLSSPRPRRPSRGPSRSMVGSAVARLGAQEAAEFMVSDVLPPSLQSGSYTQQGKKPGFPGWTNQDCHLEMNLNDGKFLAGIFDGHGAKGRQVSHRIKDLFASMAHNIAAAVDTNAALRQAFAICQATIESEGLCDESGATTTLALIDSRQEAVSVAHVGDSTALVSSPDGSIAFQTRDHKPDAASEHPRLQAHGTGIVNGRICFDSGSFALARSMGDSWSQRYGVIAEPEIVCGLPFKSGYSLTIASDGVWDMISKHVVASTVAHARPQEAVQSIVNAAQLRWSATNYMDDITAVTVKASSLDSTVRPPKPTLLGRRRDDNVHSKIPSTSC